MSAASKNQDLKAKTIVAYDKNGNIVVDNRDKFKNKMKYPC